MHKYFIANCTCWGYLLLCCCHHDIVGLPFSKYSFVAVLVCLHHGIWSWCLQLISATCRLLTCHSPSLLVLSLFFCTPYCWTQYLFSVGVLTCNFAGQVLSTLICCSNISKSQLLQVEVAINWSDSILRNQCSICKHSPSPSFLLIAQAVSFWRDLAWYISLESGQIVVSWHFLSCCFEGLYIRRMTDFNFHASASLVLRQRLLVSMRHSVVVTASCCLIILLNM